MEMEIFRIKIFKYQLDLKCFHRKDYILDKINHNNRKLNVVNMNNAFNLLNSIKIIVFYIKKCTLIWFYKFLQKYSRKLIYNGPNLLKKSNKILIQMIRVKLCSINLLEF